MKKLSILAALSLVMQTALVKAQIQQGNVMVGGSLPNLSLGLGN